MSGRSAQPISVAAFDAIGFTFIAFAILTTTIRFYLWTFVLRAGVLDSVLAVVGTVGVSALSFPGKHELTVFHTP